MVRARPQRRGHHRRGRLSPSPRSLGEPRPRPAPAHWRLLAPNGQFIERHVSSRVLVVAVKENCDGCRDFYLDDGTMFGDLEVLVIAREGVFENARRPVYLAPELLLDLEITAPPFFVLVGGDPLAVVTEGVVFSSEQVMAEITDALGEGAGWCHSRP